MIMTDWKSQGMLGVRVTKGKKNITTYQKLKYQIVGQDKVIFTCNRVEMVQYHFQTCATFNTDSKCMRILMPSHHKEKHLHNFYRTALDSIICTLFGSKLIHDMYIVNKLIHKLIALV